MDGRDGEVCALAVVGGQGWGFGVVVPVDCSKQDRCGGSRRAMRRVGYRPFGSIQGLEYSVHDWNSTPGRWVPNPLVGSLLVGKDPKT